MHNDVGRSFVREVSKKSLPSHVPPPRPIAEIDALRAQFEFAAHAPSTRRGYSHEMSTFAAWCRAVGAAPLPATPDTVARYLVERAAQGRKSGTLRYFLSAVALAHRAIGQPSPTEDIAVERAMRGIERMIGTRRTPKTAATVPILRQLLAATSDDTLLGKRNRAILLLGFASALRRSELCALRLEHVAHDARGITIFIARSKTDQTGEGQTVGVPRALDDAVCPVRALGEWVVAAGIERGPVFLAFRGRSQSHLVAPTRACGVDTIVRTIKAAARRAGLDPRDFAGHSLRRGLATSAARAKKDIRAIQAQLRHAQATTTLRYVEEAALLDDDNAVAGLL